MNAEQLHAVAKELKEEIDSAGLVNLLQQLKKALDQAVNQPQEPQHQTQIGELRTKLADCLTPFETEERSIMKRQIIDELGATSLLGVSLLQRVDDSFTQKGVTLALVRDDVETIRTELSQFREGLDQLTQGFARFNIGFEELDEYTAELGILIPRREHKEDLGFFAKDITNLNKELQPFHELVTGQATNFRIRTLSSSDFSIFLDALPATAQLIVSTIALLLFGYEKLLDIRKKRQELKDQDAPDDVVSSIEQWAQNLMEEKVNEITDDLIERHDDVARPDGREHELKVSLRGSVRKLAGRIDVGYHFSARVGPPPEPEDPDSPTPEEAQRQEIVQSIKKDSSTLEYREMPGDSVLPLAWQPDGSDESADEQLGDDQPEENDVQAPASRKRARKKR